MGIQLKTHFRDFIGLCAMVLCAGLFAAGCASGEASKQNSALSKNSRAIQDCGSCMRMCEVGGESKGREDAVAKCKDHCKKTCKEK